MHDITGKKIAILATDGFEQSEMMVPKRKLEDAGAEVEIVSLKPRFGAGNTATGATRFRWTRPSMG